MSDDNGTRTGIEEVKRFELAYSPDIQGMQFDGKNSKKIVLWLRAILGEDTTTKFTARGSYILVEPDGEQSIAVLKDEWLIVQDKFHVVHETQAAIDSGTWIKPLTTDRAKKIR